MFQCLIFPKDEIIIIKTSITAKDWLTILYQNDFQEISIDSTLDNNSSDNLESISLRQPNKIYFELYKKARDKAKHAKKEAILAYLEAKNIKNTYMIDNLNDEDYSTLDDEIDEVSESELEELER